MSGLLVNGAECDVAGLKAFNRKTVAWARPPAWRARTEWVRQYIVHKTIADDPEQLVAGAGPAGRAKATVNNWQGQYDGAHLVTDLDGTVYCLADLQRDETYHATVSNAWSIGHEMEEEVGGHWFQATLDATVTAVLAGCRMVGIQWQMPRLGSYTGHPIPRMIAGGPDMVGIFGHRDNTEQRGHWDPGDLIFQALAKAGVEQFDFAHHEDMDVWAQRQKQLGIVADGVPGPGTVAALKRAGYIDGIWALGKYNAAQTAVKVAA